MGREEAVDGGNSEAAGCPSQSNALAIEAAFILGGEPYYRTPARAA